MGDVETFPKRFRRCPDEHGSTTEDPLFEEFRKGFDVAHVGTVETFSDPKKVSTSPRFTQIVFQTSRRRNVSGVGESTSPLPPTYLGAVETFLAFRVKGFDVAHMGTVETFSKRFRRRPYGHRRNLWQKVSTSPRSKRFRRCPDGRQCKKVSTSPRWEKVSTVPRFS